MKNYSKNLMNLYEQQYKAFMACDPSHNSYIYKLDDEGNLTRKSPTIEILNSIRDYIKILEHQMDIEGAWGLGISKEKDDLVSYYELEYTWYLRELNENSPEYGCNFSAKYHLEHYIHQMEMFTGSNIQGYIIS